MRFSFGKIWAAAVCLLVFASCAKDTSESYAGIEQRSLDAWMKLHRPELLGNRQEARGFSYYVDVLDAGSTDKADTLIAETTKGANNSTVFTNTELCLEYVK